MSITSAANPRIKDVVRLRNRRARDATSRFIVEGYRELHRAFDAGIDLEEVFYCPSLFLGSNEQALLDRTGSTLTEVAEAPFRKMSYRDRPEGLLAVARMFPTGLENLPTRPDTLYLVVESIEKPGNLGTMLRTACACAVDGVIVCDPTTDVFNPNVVRSSIGTVFMTSLAVTSTEATIDWLAANSVTTYAANPDAPDAYWDVDYVRPLAVVLGSEQYGLSDPWKTSARHVAIPMPGKVDSLNVATAAALVLYEVLRRS